MRSGCARVSAKGRLRIVVGVVFAHFRTCLRRCREGYRSEAQ
jgi:hypothetical protein